MDAQLIAAESGVAAGLVGAYVHRRGRPRAWLPHLIMGAAMAAMALPNHDPLGPAGWMLVLGFAAAWSLGRPGHTDRPKHQLPKRPHHLHHPHLPNLQRPAAATALDLYVMGVLTLLMPAVHQGDGHNEHDTTASGWWETPYAGVLAVWLVARLALAVTGQRQYATPKPPPAPAAGPVVAKPTISSACSTVMIGAMAVMAFAG